VERYVHAVFRRGYYTDLRIEMIEAEEERMKERDAAKKARQEKSDDKETPAKETSSKKKSDS
jgi:hypothetical protein